MSQLPEEGVEAKAAIPQYLGAHVAGPGPLPLSLGVGVGHLQKMSYPGHPGGYGEPDHPLDPNAPTWYPSPTPRVSSGAATLLQAPSWPHNRDRQALTWPHHPPGEC